MVDGGWERGDTLNIPWGGRGTIFPPCCVMSYKLTVTLVCVLVTGDSSHTFVHLCVQTMSSQCPANVQQLGRYFSQTRAQSVLCI